MAQKAELTYGDALAADKALLHLSEEKFPVSVSLKIIRNTKFLADVLSTFEEMRGKLWEEFSVVDPKKGELIPEENSKEFMEKFNELLSSEAEIEFEPMAIEELGNVQVVPRDLISIEYMTREND